MTALLTPEQEEVDLAVFIEQEEEAARSEAFLDSLLYCDGNANREAMGENLLFDCASPYGNSACL